MAGADDLLAGVEPLQDVLAGRALAHLGDELLDDLEVDVRLEQREPDLAHRLRDRLLVEAALAAQVAEGVLIGVPAVGGVLLGTWLQQRVPVRALSLAFAGLLVLVAVELLVPG